MRFWNPRHAAAYRIVEDALDYYGMNRVRALADHFVLTEQSQKSFDEVASSRFSQGDDQTYMLYLKLLKLHDSSKTMFEGVKSEFKKYSSKGEKK